MKSERWRSIRYRSSYCVANSKKHRHGASTVYHRERTEWRNCRIQNQAYLDCIQPGLKRDYKSLPYQVMRSGLTVVSLLDREMSPLSNRDDSLT